MNKAEPSAPAALSLPLSNRQFRLLWIGGMVSNLGSMVQAVGAGWLMATIATSDDFVAFVQAATTLPVMLFSIFAGALADSYDRRLVLVAAQLIMMASSIFLAAFVLTGNITPELLLMFTFLIGTGTALHTPSWQASVGDVLPREQIPTAVSLNSMGLNLTRSVGPALGGAIVSIAGTAAAFLFNVASFVPMLIALWRYAPPKKDSALPREDLPRAVTAGLRYVSMSPGLLRLFARGFVFGLVAIVGLALLPLVARDLVQGGPLTYGLLLGAYGIGAIGGGLTNQFLRSRISTESIVRASFFGIALAVAGVAMSTHVIVTTLLLMPLGACWVYALSLFNVTVQMSSPRWVVGRTLSLYQTASFGGMAAGSWVWGQLADAYGTPAAMLTAATCAVVGGLVGLWVSLPNIPSLNLDPLNEFREPELHLDIKARSGPIMITVEYDIPEAGTADFLAAMTERRRIRIRDGGQHWVLLRDLERPSVWTEVYHVPTWVEYVRHNSRRTQADAESTERLRLLNRGERPVVRRSIERPTVPKVDDLPVKGDIHP